MTLFVVGHYYEFHKERVISRPGAALVTRAGIEIGPEISRERHHWRGLCPGETSTRCGKKMLTGSRHRLSRVGRSKKHRISPVSKQ